MDRGPAAQLVLRQISQLAKADEVVSEPLGDVHCGNSSAISAARDGIADLALDLDYRPDVEPLVEQQPHHRGVHSPVLLRRGAHILVLHGKYPFLRQPGGRLRGAPGAFLIEAKKLGPALDRFRFYREGISVMKITLAGTAAEEAAPSAFCRAILGQCLALCRRRTKVSFVTQRPLELILARNLM